MIVMGIEKNSIDDLMMNNSGLALPKEISARNHLMIFNDKHHFHF